MGIGAVAIIVVIALIAVLAGGGDDDKNKKTTTKSGAGKGEIFLESASSPGPEVFTPPVVTPTTTTSTSSSSTSTSTSSTTSTTAPPSKGGVQSTAGDGIGLYGGTKDIASCDVSQLVTFLTTTDPTKGRAWATVEHIEFSEIATYVESLTSVILRSDTRVTNHGYSNGVATARQSVLQAGTAVLVDKYGVPRTRCYCGNPLTEAFAVPVTPVYTGDPWPAFDPGKLIVIQQSTTIINTFTLIDIHTNEAFGRPVGSDGDHDGPPPSDTTNTSAPPTTTTTAANTAITSLGTGTASSTAPGGDFGPENAFDNDPASSWFSAGDAEGPDSTFTWTAGRDVYVSSISIANNAQHANPAFRSGYSFASMTVQVLDSSGQIVSSVESQVQDQNVTVNVGVVGRTIKLLLHDHLNPDCGGFSAFVVNGHAA